MEAIEKGERDIAIKLICSINQSELYRTNDLGQTVLHVASMKGCNQIVELLFEKIDDEIISTIDDIGRLLCIMLLRNDI